MEFNKRVGPNNRVARKTLHCQEAWWVLFIYRRSFTNWCKALYRYNYSYYFIISGFLNINLLVFAKNEITLIS